MGTWGTGVFSDDAACDVRAEFRELIGDGLSSEEATARILKESGADLSDEAVAAEDAGFWLGLAATQWQCGRLLDAVKAKTLRVIDAGADLELWEEEGNPNNVARRRVVLGKLREQLLSPQPRPKKIRKVYRDRTEWEVGHAVSYRLLSGRLVVFRVIHVEETGKDRTAIVDVCDWVGDSPPDGETIAALPRLHTRFLAKSLQEYDAIPQPKEPRQMPPDAPDWYRKLLGDPAHWAAQRRRVVENDGKMALYALKARDFPTDRVRVIGVGLPVAPAEHGIQGASYFGGWKGLDEFLETWFGLR